MCRLGTPPASAMPRRRPPGSSAARLPRSCRNGRCGVVPQHDSRGQEMYWLDQPQKCDTKPSGAQASCCPTPNENGLPDTSSAISLVQDTYAASRFAEKAPVH
jgi:hypothetical protein